MSHNIWPFTMRVLCPVVEHRATRTHKARQQVTMAIVIFCRLVVALHSIVLLYRVMLLALLV